MCAWRPDDEFYDRAEARGEAAALDGVDATEGFYPEFTLEPESGLRAELRILDALIDEIVERAA